MHSTYHEHLLYNSGLTWNSLEFQLDTEGDTQLHNVACINDDDRNLNMHFFLHFFACVASWFPFTSRLTTLIQVVCLETVYISAFLSVI